MDKLVNAFDMLDIVLAVFGALIFSMWRGRGKSLGGLLSGALMGGLVKPTFAVMLAAGVILAVSQPSPALKQTPDQEDKIIEFWTKKVAPKAP